MFSSMLLSICISIILKRELYYVYFTILSTFLGTLIEVFKMKKIIEFLRPEWRKISVFVILFLFLPLPFYIIPSEKSVGIPRPTDSSVKFNEPYWILSPISLFIYSYFHTPEIVALSMANICKSVWIFCLINIAICYVLSCLIIFLYNKFKPLK